MGWRFRKSFKVIPGLRLNLSKSGLSASIGGAPFTLNVSPRRSMTTVSLPGTGISYRHQSGFGVRPTDTILPAPSLPPSPNPVRLPLPVPTPISPTIPTGLPIEQVHSASTELLTSESLRELKNLIQTTFVERDDITRQLTAAQAEQQIASNRYSRWLHGFLFKRIFKKAFAKRQSQHEEACARVAELQEQLRLTTIATHIEIEKDQAEPYFRMRDEFAALCECVAIWDIKCHQATDKFRERTTASVRLGRQAVKFTLDSSDLIQWEQKLPHLQNAKGGDLFLYPGFILYRAAREAFSVIDYHDVKIEVSTTAFQEEGGVPSDSQVIGQTWAKANKDGSRDRRFAVNYQIPIARYGCLTLKSNSGLWEEFEFSNPARLDRFTVGYRSFVASFKALPPIVGPTN